MTDPSPAPANEPTAPSASGRPVAIVTGSSSGIGAAVARRLTEQGWAVGGLDLSDSSTCDASVVVDISDPIAVAAAVARLESQLGPISAAVSVAGHYETVRISDITGDAWTRMLRVHLGGIRNVTKAVLPGMIARYSGSIVAITSELAIGGGDREAHYAAAKGAIIGFVRSLAVEVAGAGIRVNAVAPGPTDTPLLAPDSPWRDPGYLATLPSGRLGTAPEVAQCVSWLIREGTFCVGEVLNPNAGAVI